MPLLKGNNKAIIGENIKEMQRKGHSEASSVAAAMQMAKGKGKVKPKAKPAKPAKPSDHDDDEWEC